MFISLHVRVLLLVNANDNWNNMQAVSYSIYRHVWMHSLFLPLSSLCFHVCLTLVSHWTKQKVSGTLHWLVTVLVLMFELYNYKYMCMYWHSWWCITCRLNFSCMTYIILNLHPNKNYRHVMTHIVYRFVIIFFSLSMYCCCWKSVTMETILANIPYTLCVFSL